MKAVVSRVCLLVFVFVVVEGCSNRAARVSGLKINASAAGAKAIEQHDANKDGKLDDAELQQCPALRFARAEIDVNGDRAVTAEEISKRIESWQESRLGRMSIACAFSRKGKPLSGVEVKLVPEKFLGEGLPAATGVTDSGGGVWPNMPVIGTDEVKGVAPGFYRIELSGGGLPAKYQANSNLGIEISRESLAPEKRHRLQFDLP